MWPNKKHQKFGTYYKQEGAYICIYTNTCKEKRNSDDFFF